MRRPQSSPRTDPRFPCTAPFRSASGIDPTGKLLHEAAPGGVYLNHLSALFSRGAAGPGALYNRSSYAYEDAPGPRSISRVFMPLAGDGSSVDMLMIGQKATRDLRSGKSAWQANPPRSEEHTSELQSLMRISYAVFCLKKK